MLAVFSFCHKDADLALKQAQWIKELGGVQNHNALVVCNRMSRSKGLEKPIVDALSAAFNFVDVFTPFDQVEDGWPSSPNHMWIRAVQHVRDAKQDVPFLWMEPDAIPVRKEWLDRIDSQFSACGKPFMGAYVTVQDVAPHMSGVAVYHQTWLHVPEFSCVTIAWDVALAKQILPKYYQTKLIQHEWKPDSFPDWQSLSRVRPEALIYHQCKDGSLIDRLRESRGSVEVARPVFISGEAAGSTPAPATSEVEQLKAKIQELTEVGARLQDELASLKRLPVDRVVKPAKPAKAKRGWTPERKAEMSRKAKALWSLRKGKVAA